MRSSSLPPCTSDLDQQGISRDRNGHSYGFMVRYNFSTCIQEPVIRIEMNRCGDKVIDFTCCFIFSNRSVPAPVDIHGINLMASLFQVFRQDFPAMDRVENKDLHKIDFAFIVGIFF